MDRNVFAIGKRMGTLAFAAAFALSVAPLRADTHAFPVPYVEKDDGGSGITFTEVPNPGSIRIFDVSGEEVVDLDVAPGEITKNWQLNASNGGKVASGVYFYVIDGGPDRITGKIVVIR